MVSQQPDDLSASPVSYRRNILSRDCCVSSFLYIMCVAALVSYPFAGFMLPKDEIDFPYCQIQTLTLTSFDLTQNRTLTSIWSVTIRANKTTDTPSALTYRRLNLSVSYIGAVIASEELPTFTQRGTKAFTIEANASSIGHRLGLRAYGGLQEEVRGRGEAEFDVALDGPVRICLVTFRSKMKCSTAKYFHYKLPPHTVVIPSGSPPLSWNRH